MVGSQKASNTVTPDSAFELSDINQDRDRADCACHSRALLRLPLNVTFCASAFTITMAAITSPRTHKKQFTGSIRA